MQAPLAQRETRPEPASAFLDPSASPQGGQEGDTPVQPAVTLVPGESATAPAAAPSAAKAPAGPVNLLGLDRQGFLDFCGGMGE